MSSSSSLSVPYPRAAVAITVQMLDGETPKYLLVQRANEPDKGKWSLPGGKISVGEPTLEAAKRELEEETQIQPADCVWSPFPFMTTDAIVPSASDDAGTYAFHYVIAQCFARAIDSDATISNVVPSDDAMDARWFALRDIQHMDDTTVSAFVRTVIERAEELHQKGAVDE